MKIFGISVESENLPIEKEENVGQTIIGDVYWSSADQPFSTWPEGWERVDLPQGIQTMEISFTLTNNDTVKLLGEFVQSKLSDAAIMDEWIRESHRLPDVRDTKLLRDMNVIGFGMTYNAMGYFKPSYFDFADGSSYEHAVVYD